MNWKAIKYVHKYEWGILELYTNPIESVEPVD
jgi:hypothetical protein